MKGLVLLVSAFALLVGCGGDTDDSSGTGGGASGGSGGASQGGTGNSTSGGGGSGGAIGGSAGTPTGGAGGSVTGGAAGTGGNTGGIGNTGGGTGIPCNPGDVLCDGPTPTCPEGQVPSVQGSCWGPCVPILDCATVPSCDNCQGFCAAYAGFTTEYRCVMPSITCAALACICMAKYFCVDPYNACDDSGGPNDPPITCACPAC